MKKGRGNTPLPSRLLDASELKMPTILYYGKRTKSMVFTDLNIYCDWLMDRGIECDLLQLRLKRGCVPPMINSGWITDPYEQFPPQTSYYSQIGSGKHSEYGGEWIDVSSGNGRGEGEWYGESNEKEHDGNTMDYFGSGWGEGPEIT